MTDTHALQAVRDKVAAGDLPGVLPIAFCESVLVIAAFHGSLSAAKELHEALLPDWKWWVDYSGEVGLWHKTGPKHGAVDVGEYECAGNPARSWVLAILDALIYEASETSDKA